MSDEAPFTSLDDEPAQVEVIDAARLLEQTGERWLSFSEAVALLLEREPTMSTGYAEHIIDYLRVSYFAGRRSGKAAPVRCFMVWAVGLFNENNPHRGNTLVNEPDLI